MSPVEFSAQQMIDEIVACFDANGIAREVPKSRVLEWMRCPSLEVRGAIYTMVSDAHRASRVRPHLEFEDYFGFVLDYLEQCIESDPDGEWADSRYLAGHQLVAWVDQFWTDQKVPPKKLDEVKSRLAALYVRGDRGVRTAVVTGVLEHLFERKQIAKYFGDWEKDSTLADAYRNALLWTEKKL